MGWNDRLEPAAVYRQFLSVSLARAYRHQYGTGGWIFVPADESEMVTLFPPHMPPSDIMAHKLTRGLSGELIGCGEEQRAEEKQLTIDLREYDHDYGQVWQELCDMPLDGMDVLNGRYVERVGANEYVVWTCPRRFEPETTSRAGAVELIVGRPPRIT